VDAVLDGFGAVIVGHAVSVAAANAAAGQPDGEGLGVVVAAGLLAFALGGGSAAEFTAEKYESILEHAAHFQIAEQRGDRLIDLGAAFGQTFVDGTVMIPAGLTPQTAG
jgi:hypothetical protein